MWKPFLALGFAIVASTLPAERASAQSFVVPGPIVVPAPLVTTVPATAISPWSSSYVAGYHGYSTYYAPPSVASVTVLSAPVVTVRPAVRPVARAIAAVPFVAPAPVVVARPAIVAPRYYHPGQPVRNVLRAVTP